MGSLRRGPGAGYKGDSRLFYQKRLEWAGSRAKGWRPGEHDSLDVRCAVVWLPRERRALACPSSRIKAGVKTNAKVYYDTVAANMDLGSALGREMRSKRGRGMRARAGVRVSALCVLCVCTHDRGERRFSLAAGLLLFPCPRALPAALLPHTCVAAAAKARGEGPRHVPHLSPALSCACDLKLCWCNARSDCLGRAPRPVPVAAARLPAQQCFAIPSLSLNAIAAQHAYVICDRIPCSSVSRHLAKASQPHRTEQGRLHLETAGEQDFLLRARQQEHNGAAGRPPSALPCAQQQQC